MPANENTPRFVLGREIARGGLGRVVEAFDTELKRTVAVKLVLDELPAAVRERFVREAELTARLEHPNIVPVHGLVGGEGAPMQLAMKRVQGRDLASLIGALAAGEREAEQAWSRPRLLAMFQQVCLGVAFAHDRGVIHRDLKPSNVMLGDYGETLIVDWGLAKEKGSVAGEAAGRAEAPKAEDRTFVPVRSGGAPGVLTLEGDVLGTPAYMPPEQAEGRQHDVDERSDIYSLGAILYEILSLRAPVEGDSLEEVLTRVKTGAIVPPSRGVSPARPAAAVPPELDAIVMKALALRREDRYPTARALHDDIQLFLEGVKEREHRARSARERVEAGRRWLARYREMKGAIDSQAARVKHLSAEIRPHRSPEDKRPLWEAETALQAMREERVDAFAKASAEFGQALTVDPGSADALDGTCELFLDRFLEAERRRDREEMQLNRSSLSTYDRDGRYLGRLDAPGRLSLRAAAFGCGCLRPAKEPGWKVEIGEVPDAAWRDGGPVNGERVEDGGVPRIATAGRPWGHTPACSRAPLPGVEAWIAKYEERDRRLVLGPERRLGELPLDGVTLPQGSYRCTLRPRDEAYAQVLLPVLIRRSGHWDQDVTFYRRDEIPAGFLPVAGGPFTFGGAWAGGQEEQVLGTRDFFLSGFAVTCAEYLVYLNALGAADRLEEARRRQPREADKKWWIEEGGRFRLPPPDADPRLPWDPRWPVFSVDWSDALAYAAWRGTRDGVPFRLMHEEEYERALRGADGRVYAFGDVYDGSYAHTSLSLAGGHQPRPVGTFAADESPCGARDLSGCIATWCWNAALPPFHGWRATRGGAWSLSPAAARGGLRRVDAPTHLAWYYGIRLVLPPGRETP
ncbi:MAG: SUMF1/EgtB/PvdO family nonheme iron enzyme [Planctomycetia bacterium]|nr:SUMF1/EgtB/PvdO family nonheme iron enzyme [Planctomycetia bacterium]